MLKTLKIIFLLEKNYLGVFGVDDYESAIALDKFFDPRCRIQDAGFNMAASIWR